MNFTRPTRAMINQPSKLQKYHEHHGKIGIAIAENTHPDYRQEVKDIVTIYFTVGSILSMKVNKNVLSGV